MVQKKRQKISVDSPVKIAVVKSGGKQFVVKEGDSFLSEKLPSSSGSIEFKDLLAGKKVRAKIGDAVRGKKITMLKFKNKTRRLKFKGHRQNFVKLTVEKIT